MLPGVLSHTSRSCHETRLFAPARRLAAAGDLYGFAADLSPKGPDKLQGARALIAQKNWAGAIDELQKVNAPESADWNNLMGWRKADANIPEAEKYYNEAGGSSRSTAAR